MAKHRVDDLLSAVPLQVLQHHAHPVLNLLRLRVQEAVPEQGPHRGQDQDKVHLRGGHSAQLEHNGDREGGSLLMGLEGPLKPHGNPIRPLLVRADLKALVPGGLHNRPQVDRGTGEGGTGA